MTFCVTWPYLILLLKKTLIMMFLKEVVSMNMNDTIFLFLCTLLVWLMTPGLSLFYGGLVQSKNALNTVMQSMVAIVIVTFIWIMIILSLTIKLLHRKQHGFTYYKKWSRSFGTLCNMWIHCKRSYCTYYITKNPNCLVQ